MRIYLIIWGDVSSACLAYSSVRQTKSSNNYVDFFPLKCYGLISYFTGEFSSEDDEMILNNSIKQWCTATFDSNDANNVYILFKSSSIHDMLPKCKRLSQLAMIYEAGVNK